MQNSVAKKIFAVGVAASTILMSLAPFAAQAAAHAVGTNVLASDGTVWMVMPDGTRRAYTSGGAFLSYGFNSFASVVTANADDLALPTGGFIPPQDGKVLCSDRGADKGTCYLITGAQKGGFTSAAVFTGLGFSFSRAAWADVSWMGSTSNIDNTTAAHRPGVLVNNNGTVQLVGTTGLLGIPDIATFNSWGYSFADVVPANAADKAMTQTGVMAARIPGQLSPTALTTGPNPPPAGSVSYSAASTQTPASTVPEQATNLNVLKFVVSNGSSAAAAVTQVTVKRTGAGATTNIANVYLYQGASRLTSGRSVNSSSNEAVFSGLNISVPANGSVTLDVVVDIANGATGTTHQFSVTSVMLGSTAATGSAMGNAMTIASVDVGVVTIAKTGSVSNPKVGEQNVKVASFTLAADSSEDVVVKRVSLFNSGSVASSNLTNLVLKQAGNTLATVASMDSKDKANFELSFSLAKGDTKTFEVYANIGAGARSGSTETLKFYIEESTDVYAVGSTYGFGASITKTGYDGDSCTSTAGDCSYSTIDGGTLTITFNGPAAKDVAKNGKDVEVFNFTMAAQNNLEVRQMSLTFAGGTGTANFCSASCGTQLYTDVKIIDTTTGGVVWGPLDFNDGADTTETITFSEDIFLAAGTSRTYKVTLDVANNSSVASGDTVAATLDVDSLTSSDVKNVDNNTFLTASDVVPTSDLAGNTMTVRIPSLEVALGSTPTSKSIVKGTPNVDAAGFVFTASTAGDVKVTDITLTGMIASSTSTSLADGRQALTATTYVNVSDDITSVELYDGSTKLGQTKSPAITTGLVAFTSLNWTIPAGQSRTLVVRMNISSSATASDKIKWQIEDGNVTAIDSDGNAVVDTSGATTTIPDADLNDAASTTSGTTITITGNGTITAAAAGTETDITDARVVIAGKAGVTLGKIRFTAVDEELKLTKARINVFTASAGQASANIGDDITALYLYDGSTKIAGPVSLTPSGTTEGYAEFNGLAPEFIIGKDASKNLTVTADLNTISNGADSGDEFNVSLSSTNFEARGTSGSTVRTSFTGSYAGNFMVLRKSQPKVETVALTSSALSSGTVVLYRFKVTAMDNDVAIKHVEFSSSTSTGVTLTTFNIAPMGGSNLSPATDLTYTAGNVVVKATFATQEVITSGSSKTYDLKATVTLSGQTSYSVATGIRDASNTAIVTGDLSSATSATLSLQDKDATNDVGDDYNDSDTTPSLLWSDMSATSHNDTANGTDDWTNGRYIRSLPTDSQGLSQN